MHATITTDGRALTRPILLILAATALVVSLFAIARPAMASHVDPVFVDSENPTCESLGYGDAVEVKFDASVINSGTHTYSEGDFSITITSDADRTHFSFEDADPPVQVLIVKAGNGANVYYYDPAVSADSDLETPNNGGDQQAGLSHFTICLGEAGESESQSQSASASQSVEQSVSASQSASASASASSSAEQSVEGNTGTPEQSVQGGTGSPAASMGNGSVTSQGTSSAIPAIAFGILALLSLGGLAAVNLATARRRR